MFNCCNSKLFDISVSGRRSRERDDREIIQITEAEAFPKSQQGHYALTRSSILTTAMLLGKVRFPCY